MGSEFPGLDNFLIMNHTLVWLFHTIGQIAMPKTTKFTISMSAAEFKKVESLRRRTGRTRSQFIRDAVAALSRAASQSRSVMEEHSEYGAPPASDSLQVTDPAERRRRALAAAGRFHSGTADLSSDHDRYLDEAFAEASPGKEKD
jgi:hypothetical protein